MKYKEWTGDLEGTIPDIGHVSKGQVVQLDTTAKLEAAETHKQNFKTLTLEEGEARFEAQERKRAKQVQADAEPEAAQPEVAQPDAPAAAEPAATEPTPADDSAEPQPDTAKPSGKTKGGKA